MRTFDIETVAPYDHMGLVAFLRAAKLEDLTSRQIRVFLLLRDATQADGLTASWIAQHLDITPNTVRSCLSVLKRKGYARHSSNERRDKRGGRIVYWAHDPSHVFADEDDLFWEFAKI